MLESLKHFFSASSCGCSAKRKHTNKNKRATKRRTYKKRRTLKGGYSYRKSQRHKQSRQSIVLGSA